MKSLILCVLALSVSVRPAAADLIAARTAGMSYTTGGPITNITPFLGFGLQPEGALLFDACVGCDGGLGIATAAVVDRDVTGLAASAFLARLTDSTNEIVWSGAFSVDGNGTRFGAGVGWYESQIFGGSLPIGAPIDTIRLFVLTATVNEATNSVNTLFRWEFWDTSSEAAPELALARSLLLPDDFLPTTDAPTGGSDPGTPTPEPASLLLIALGSAGGYWKARRRH